MNNKMTTAAAVAMLALLPSFAMVAEPVTAGDRVPQEIFKTIPPKDLMAPPSILGATYRKDIKEIPAPILNQLKPSDFKHR